MRGTLSVGRLASDGVNCIGVLSEAGPVRGCFCALPVLIAAATVCWVTPPCGSGTGSKLVCFAEHVPCALPALSLV